MGKWLEPSYKEHWCAYTGCTNDPVLYVFVRPSNFNSDHTPVGFRNLCLEHYKTGIALGAISQP